MATDRRRYREFREELAALVDRLPAEELARTIRAKLLDYLVRSTLDDPSHRELVQLFEALLGDDLAGYVQAVVQTYDQIVDVVNTLYADLGVDVRRDFDRIRAIERANNSYLGKYSEATIERIAREVRKALTQQLSAEELVAAIEPISHKTHIYGRAVAQTQIKRYARGLKNEKARIAEVEYFEYVGVVRPTIRPFCAEHVGKTYSLATIHGMRNGNLEPVILNCGGWNCVHDWEPDPFATKEST